MIEGEIFEKVESKDLAFEAGKVLGQFLAIMKNFDGQKLKSSLVLHQSKKNFK